MPSRRSLLGRRGEAAAREFLEQRGYTVLAENYRCPWGELDIVAQQGETVVFVEVRTRRSHAFGTPEESVTRAKGQHLVASAEHYLQEHSLTPPWRIDLMAVRMDSKGTITSIRQVENAVQGE